MRPHLILASVLVSGCASADRGPEPVAAPHAARIIATDYTFDAPDTIPAGHVSWSFEGNGPSSHHVIIARVEAGHTVAEALDSLEAGSRPAWLVTMGGLEQPGAGITDARFTMDMAAGDYVLMCILGSADGRTHAMEGMVSGLTVIGAGEAPATDVIATDTLRMIDFAFAVPDTITAGNVRLRLENTGQQRHHALIEQVPDTISMQQLLADFTLDEPPPGYRSIGGFTSMAPGERGWYEVTLLPGRYMVACLVTDPATGRAHAELGMIRLIEVVAAR